MSPYFIPPPIGRTTIVAMDLRDRCDCPNVADGSTSPEAARDFMFRPDNIAMIQWSSPVTNRLLLEAAFVSLPLGWGNRINEGIDPSLVQVVEQNPAPGTPRTYRGGSEYSWTQYPFWNVGFNATYVTGAPAIKAGFNDNWGYAKTHWQSSHPIQSYRFSRGVPNEFTVGSNPRDGHVKVDKEIGLYLQDRWTYKRMTLSGGVRYCFVADRDA